MIFQIKKERIIVMTKRIVSILLAIVMIASLSVTFVSAATDADLDTARKVSVTLNCNKTGYVFELYRIADLVKTTNPYSVKYDVKVTNTAVRTAVANGNFAEADRSKILDALDKDSALSGATAIGAYEVAEDGNTKTFGNLAQGIYYVRAINFPAGVKSVTNSCFALPYCNENGWIYSIDAINLAAKVAEDEPEIIKEITNSTKGDVNFTDVSIGDTVEFEITTSVLGAVNEVPEHDFKLNSYIISDVMSKGLTLNQNSFTVYLTDDDYNVISAIAPENYTVSVTAADGEDTTFTVSLKKAYLQTAAAFYSAAYVVTDFSAVLNKYATTEVVGNPNEAVKLTYSNKNDVQGEVEGNKVFVYTYKLEVHKFDDAGAKLQGAEFVLYKTEANAREERNAIATIDLFNNRFNLTFNSSVKLIREGKVTVFFLTKTNNLSCKLLTALATVCPNGRQYNVDAKLFTLIYNKLNLFIGIGRETVNSNN